MAGISVDARISNSGGNDLNARLRAMNLTMPNIDAAHLDEYREQYKVILANAWNVDGTAACAAAIEKMKNLGKPAVVAPSKPEVIPQSVSAPVAVGDTFAVNVQGATFCSEFTFATMAEAQAFSTVAMRQCAAHTMTESSLKILKGGVENAAKPKMPVDSFEGAETIASGTTQAAKGISLSPLDLRWIIPGYAPVFGPAEAVKAATPYVIEGTEASWDGAKTLGRGAVNEAKDLGHGAVKLGEGAWNGAKDLGRGAVNEAKDLGRGAVKLGEGAWQGTKSVGHSISEGASAAYDWMTADHISLY